MLTATRGGNMKRLVMLGTAAALLAVPVATVVADEPAQRSESANLVEAVRDATRPFRDVTAAEAAGYVSMNGCVSGPEEGAMGVHYAKGALVEDPALIPEQPEILVYEDRGGQPRLLAVEYVVPADAWNAAHPEGPPVLLGQHFHFVNGPNRYGPGAFYELHVWAWKDNPRGTFADWNPNVICDHYTVDASHAHG
jgi:hypothetical protein